jgi:hypothetical protein
LGVGWLDLNYCFGLHRFYFNLLLLAGIQLSRIFRLLTHPLDRIHYIHLLIEEGISQIRGPLYVLVQHLESIRECD